MKNLCGLAHQRRSPEEVVPNDSIEQDLEDSIEDVADEGEDEGDITPEIK